MIQDAITVSTRDRLAAYITRTGVTQVEMARRLGYSGATVSQYLGRIYSGNVAEVDARVEDLLKREEERSASSTPTPMLPQCWLETSAARRIMTLVRRTHLKRQLGLVTGDAGVGKTATLEHYARQHRSAIYVRAGMTADRPAYFLRAVGDSLGMKLPSDIYESTRRVVDTLRDSDRLLIVDEAQRLSARSLETVRDIWDQCQIGVVLSGNHAVQAQVYGQGNAAFAQHFSRLGGHVHVAAEAISADDIQTLTGGGLSGETAAVRWLVEHTRRGGLRTALNTLELAVEMRTANASVSWLEALRSAHTMRGFQD